MVSIHLTATSQPKPPSHPAHLLGFIMGKCVRIASQGHQRVSYAHQILQVSNIFFCLYLRFDHLRGFAHCHEIAHFLFNQS